MQGRPGTPGLCYKLYPLCLCLSHNPVRLVSFQEEVLKEVPRWQGTGLVCWRLSILSQYRKRGKEEDRVTHELDGKEKPGMAPTCKWRCVSGEAMPILPSSEYIFQQIQLRKCMGAVLRGRVSALVIAAI